MSTAQRTDEWFAARAGRATASRFGDILATVKKGEAAARRNYRYQLAVERITGIPQNGFSNAATDHGTEHEPAAREETEAASGLLIDDVGFVSHATLMAGASPDGLIGNDATWEAKCPYASAVHLQTIEAGEVPADHMPQIQGQLWITGRQRCLFTSFDPRMPERLRLFTKWVARDDEYIEKLAAEVERFLIEVDATVEKLSK